MSRQRKRGNWECEGYGRPGMAALGYLCFVGEAQGAPCATSSQCHEAMEAERARVLDRIQELAVQGDETGLFLAGEFTRPQQLLGGDESGS